MCQVDKKLTRTHVKNAETQLLLRNGSAETGFAVHNGSKEAGGHLTVAVQPDSAARTPGQCLTNIPPQDPWQLLQSSLLGGDEETGFPHGSRSFLLCAAPTKFLSDEAPTFSRSQ